ncbi:MAG: GNAT family N-acetyltransferase [Aequorivita antarctica]
MEIKTLNGIANELILDTFNLSFSDYFIPFRLTQEQLDSKMFADNVDLGLSVGVFEEGNLVAFILHGVNEANGRKIIYNGGTGVIPQKRGLGLTAKMYSFILPILKEKEVSALWLEVISENIPAIISYEKSGFQAVRKVFCYKGVLKVGETNTGIEIKKLDTYNWDIMKSFWDVSPTWQNSIPVLNKIEKDNISFGAYFHNKLIGYVIYNPNSKRIQQIAIDKNWRKQKIASTLISKIGKEPDSTISVINIDASAENLHDFFKKIGLDEHLGQIEMKLEI